MIVFFYVGDLSFLRITGIPKGYDPASFMENLFLYYYEKKRLLDAKNRDLRKTCLFSNTIRFIDNLCAINDHNTGALRIYILQSLSFKRKKN